MIVFLKTWANQIIIAVIIATIIEMILPNGNNKKYIKMVIGLYVLFTIIQPIITKFTGNSLEVLDFNYEKYFDKDILESSTENFEDNNSKLIKQAYIDNIKSDIETKMKHKGYKISDCNIDIIDNENLNTFGTIENISFKIEKIGEEKVELKSENIVKVESIDINVINTNNLENKETENEEVETNISDKEKRKIIEYLANEYSVNKECIILN